LIQRKRNLEEGKKKMYMLFADLKAAFNKVERDKLWEILRDKGVSEYLVRKIEKMRKRR